MGLSSLLGEERRRGGVLPSGMPERRRSRARAGLLSVDLLAELIGPAPDHRP
jgi:hypothetical protein